MLIKLRIKIINIRIERNIQEIESKKIIKIWILKYNNKNIFKIGIIKLRVKLIKINQI